MANAPRRSPRAHKGSYPKSPEISERRNLAKCFETSGNDDSNPRKLSFNISSQDVDVRGLDGSAKYQDEFPSPPPPLSPYNDSSDSSHPVPAMRRISERNSSVVRGASSLSTFEGRTEAPSTHNPTPTERELAPVEQPSSTYAPNNPKPSCTDTNFTQPSRNGARSTQQPSHHPPNIQQPSRCASSIEPPHSNPLTTSGRSLSQEGRTSEVEEVLNLVESTQDTPETDEQDLHRLYVHISNLTVNQQKYLASAFNVVQHGNKKARGARLFVFISGVMKRKKKTVRELFQEKGLEKGKDLVTPFDRCVEIWSDREDAVVVPPIGELEELGGIRQHPEQQPQRTTPIDDESDEEDDNPLHSSARGDNVTLEEFARLMIIFRDDPEASNDLRRSGRDLQRQDLDIRANRHAFWTDRIEVLFNDPAVLTNERFDGELQDIDIDILRPGYPGRPVTSFRTGACLQNLFAKFRKEFTQLHKDWDVSGNNDPLTFVNFCRLPHQTTLTRAGARCLIAWKVFRFGTDAQNSLLLDFTSKEIARESGAQLDCGFGDGGQSAFNGKKRKYGSGGNDVNEAVLGALQSLSKKADFADANTDNTERKELDKLAIKHAKLENEKSMLSNLQEASKLAKEMTGELQQHTRIAGIIQAYCGKLAEDMESML